MKNPPNICEISEMYNKTTNNFLNNKQNVALSQKILRSTTIKIQKPRRNAMCNSPFQNFNIATNANNANTGKIKVTTNWRTRLSKFLDSTYILILMTSFTIFEMFSQDVQTAFCPNSMDFGFDISVIIAFALFSCEIVLTYLAKDEYPMSFFFWLDLFSTLTLIQEINIITDPFFNYVYQTDLSTRYSILTGRTNADMISKVSSATRAAPVVKKIKLLRLIRIAKLYKTVHIARGSTIKLEKEEKINLSRKDTGHGLMNVNINNKDKESSKRSVQLDLNKSMSASEDRKLKSFPPQNVNVNVAHKNSDTNDSQQLIGEENLEKQSQISKMLSDSIIKKIILLLLLILVCSPLISEDFYDDSNATTGYTLLSKYYANLNKFGVLDTISDRLILEAFDEDFPLIQVELDRNIIWKNENYTLLDFRLSELVTIHSADNSVIIIYSIQYLTKLSGLLNIGKTVYICICFSLTFFLVEFDSRSLVLEPLEIIMAVVVDISKDPIKSKIEDELNQGIQATLSRLMKNNNEKKKKKSYEDTHYELHIIKDAIIKIISLLVTSFGTNGTEIIRENLKNFHKHDYQMKGKPVKAIFGVFEIQNFDKIIIGLKEQSMMFVNTIADIVHTNVDKFMGFTYKNDGYMYINVWKIQHIVTGTLHFQQGEDTREAVADMSLLACLAIIKKINSNKLIAGYVAEIRKSNPQFELQMGFGLHVGRAIEGVIGSSLKIDAIYLSPQVTICNLIAGETQRFNIPIVFSKRLYKMLSENLKMHCRYIDRVYFPEGNKTYRIYTIYSDVKISIDSGAKNIRKESKLSQNEVFKAYSIRKWRKSRNLKLNSFIIIRNSSVRSLLTVISKNDEFDQTWNEALTMYKTGDWIQARHKIENCMKIDPCDIPAKSLFEYLNSFNFSPPLDWKGARSLRKKATKRIFFQVE